MTLGTLLQDPGFRNLVTRFMAELPGRAEEVRTAFHQGDLAEVRTLAHRLKGAGGSYGFEEITSHATLVERLVGEGDLDQLRESIEHLTRACLGASELTDP